MSQILIVDDEPAICWTLQKALHGEGHDVVTTASAEEALRQVSITTPDVVLMDIRLPEQDGLSALEIFQARLPHMPVIMMTAFGTLETTVQAVQQGAFEYLNKPFDLDDALDVVRRALESQPVLQNQNTTVPEANAQKLIGKSSAIQEVFRKIAYVATHDIPVLITGESGTGKELVASAIHHYSRRQQGQFVPICVPAMNESLIEAELFGHLKGAYTGAVAERNGLLVAADGGTAFFDEIGDISLATQVKLLRVFETKSVVPIGGNLGRHSDFRLVAATNRNLEQMVKSGQFRDDLFYRLNVFRIEIPPLRERPEDIPLLAEHFMRNLDPQGYNRFSATATEVLLKRTWRGNVRELRNAVEHAVVVTRTGEISPDAFPPPFAEMTSITDDPASLSTAVESWWKTQEQELTPENRGKLYESFLNAVEPALFEAALQSTQGNRQEAAQLLGIHRQTLREKLRKYGMNEGN